MKPGSDLRMRGRLLPAIAALCIFLASPLALGGERPEAEYARLVNEGNDHYRAKRYEEAARRFRKALVIKMSSCQNGLRILARDMLITQTGMIITGQ